MEEESYPMVILMEQRELLEEEVLHCEGLERDETEQRLAETITALSILQEYKFG